MNTIERLDFLSNQLAEIEDNISDGTGGSQLEVNKLRRKIELLDNKIDNSKKLQADYQAFYNMEWEKIN